MPTKFFFAYLEKTLEESIQALETRINEHFSRDSIKITKAEDTKYEHGLGRLITYEILPNDPAKEETADLFYVPEES